MARLGDILVEQGAIARADIEAFMPTASDRLGESLRAHTHIRARDLAQAIATQLGLHYVDLSQADTTLYRARDLSHYITHHYAPHTFKDNVLTIATSEPSLALEQEVSARYGCGVRMVVTSARDLTLYYARAGSSALTRRARLNLRRLHRPLVADRTLLPHQARGFLVIGATLLIAGLLDASMLWQALLIGCNIFYLVSLAFKILLYREGTLAEQQQRTLEKQLSAHIHALRDETLPIYTILVPLYQESFAVMSRLISNLHALDYPKEKLDIKLICEADDATTLGALKRLRPPETMGIIHVPPSNPRTKPKACNVALQQIRGEYLVIYDAEDAPARDQLKRSIALFERDGGKDLACLQAPLNYYNRAENLLTQLFSIEYSALFKLLLPALERMELPIPLGGTSNHLRVSALQDAGGWDAFNVTEDADLGIRLHYFGYRTRLLPSLTLEEAPIKLGGWMRQRTRWIKGYIQTWLVYMRDPSELKRRLGKQGYYGFQFFVGAPALTFLLAPVFWGVFLFSLLGILPMQLSDWLLGLCLVSFVGGMISHWIFAKAVLNLEYWRDMRLALLVFPFYWLLHSVACARALWQLVTAPHYWEKTTHGLTSFFAANPVDRPVSAR